MPEKASESLLKKIQELSFAKVEAELYLDVYPENREALNYYKNILAQLSMAMEEYQSKYAPILASGVTGDSWSWVKGMWPWQNGGTEKEGAK